MRKCLFLGLAALAVALLAACGGGGDTVGGDDRAARAVEDYLTAKVGGDQEAIRAGLCSEMESVLERELHTFDTVSGAHIEEMSCASDGPEVVRCSGQIVALYGTEETTFPLGAYRVVQEDGVYRWCGEAQ